MRWQAAAALILTTSCAVPDASGPALDGPGGARLVLPAGQSLPGDARFVLSNGTQPPLPRELVALSSCYTVEPQRVLAGLDLQVTIPSDAPGAELYASDGESWARVASTVSGGLLRATVRSASHLLVASQRPQVWHEVAAPRGSLESFAVSGRRLLATSSAVGPVVSDDEGETWVPRPAEAAPARPEPSPLAKLTPDRAAALGDQTKSWAVYALATEPGRLIATLDDGSVRFSDDAGATWRDYSGGLPAQAGGHDTVLGSDGSRLFVSRGGRTFVARAPVTVIRPGAKM